jgi:hypothetical protein
MKIIGLASMAAALVLASGAQAQTSSFGDWATEHSGDVSIAVTENQYGSSFGIICDDAQCLMFIDLAGPNCSAGDDVDMLLNADAGVFGASFTCNDTKDALIWTTRYDGPLTNIFTQGGTVSVANGLTDGSFYIVEFSLTGARQALNHIAR